MSTELTTMNQDQIALIKNTVAKGATDNELKLFLYQCNRLGLDPLSKQVHFVKYGNSPGTIITGVDGFRVVAHRTGKLSGIKRGAIKNEKGELIGAWAEVYRSDWAHPAREEVPLSEYQKQTGNWKTMPETMIKKVAECAALRMAFPSDLSGVFGAEEMDQATPHVEPKTVVPPQIDEHKPEPKSEESKPTTPVNVISEAQVKRLYTIVSEGTRLGVWEKEEAKEFIYSNAGVTSAKDIQTKDYDRITAYLEKRMLEAKR